MTTDITPQAPPQRFTYSLGATKYKSFLHVYVAQPDPTGHLIWTPSGGVGHAWWSITTEAPANAVNQLNTDSVNLEYLNQQVGYGPTNGAYGPQL